MLCFAVECVLLKTVMDRKVTNPVCFRFELEATSDTKTRAGKSTAAIHNLELGLEQKHPNAHIMFFV